MRQLGINIGATSFAAVLDLLRHGEAVVGIGDEYTSLRKTDEHWRRYTRSYAVRWQSAMQNAYSAVVAQQPIPRTTAKALITLFGEVRVHRGRLYADAPLSKGSYVSVYDAVMFLQHQLDGTPVVRLNERCLGGEHDVKVVRLRNDLELQDKRNNAITVAGYINSM